MEQTYTVMNIELVKIPVDIIFDSNKTPYHVYFKKVSNKLVMILKRVGFRGEAGRLEVQCPGLVSFNQESIYKDGYAEVINVAIHKHFRNVDLYRSMINRIIVELKQYNPRIKGVKSLNDSGGGGFRKIPATKFWEKFYLSDSEINYGIRISKYDNDYFAEKI